MRPNKKPLIIGILCVIVMVMAIGFALLSKQLTINGTSSIDSNWNIRITNIRVKNVVSAYNSGSNRSGDVSGSTGCTVNNVPCNSTEANFETKLVTPGDSVTYEVTITNSGNLDGVVESINLSPTTTDSDAIQVEKSGLTVGETIGHTSPNNTNTIDVTVTYNPNTSEQPSSTTSNITLTLNYQQDLGQVQSQSGGNNQSGNGGNATAFDTTTGTGTIYRYYSSSESGQIESLYIGDSVEGHMNDTSYGISTDPSSFQSINYLKHEVSNWNITASYVCFVTDTEHCLQGKDSNNQTYYSTNVGVLTGVQNWFASNEGSCFSGENPGGSYFRCTGAGFNNIYAYSNGNVNANASGVSCDVLDYGHSHCSR